MILLSWEYVIGPKKTAKLFLYYLNGVIMNKFMFNLLITLFMLFLTIGCQEDSSLVAPNNSTSISESATVPNWISLPTSEETVLNKGDKSNNGKYYSSGLITVIEGGSISLGGSYKGGKHGKVKFSAHIVFDANTVNEDTEFTMELNPEIGQFTFSPSYMFNKEATLTVDITGLDIDETDVDNISFVYMDKDNQPVSVDYHKITIKVKKGGVRVLKIKIPHFSRYGFTK